MVKEIHNAIILTHIPQCNVPFLSVIAPRAVTQEHCHVDLERCRKKLVLVFLIQLGMVGRCKGFNVKVRLGVVIGRRANVLKYPRELVDTQTKRLAIKTAQPVRRWAFKYGMMPVDNPSVIEHRIGAQKARVITCPILFVAKHAGTIHNATPWAAIAVEMLDGCQIAERVDFTNQIVSVTVMIPSKRHSILINVLLRVM